jgi:class 3 adenylate cyclase
LEPGVSCGGRFEQHHEDIDKTKLMAADITLYTQRNMQAGEEFHGKDEVRLEATDGRRWSIQGSCGIGRSPTNQVVLESSKISRRHALIHTQSANEYWLVDLASSNGTFLNGRRIAQPAVLHDGDTVGVGDYQLVFRQPASAAMPDQALATVTFQEVKLVECWLLLADVIEATMIMQQVAPENLPQVMGRWLVGGKEIVERHGGSINKFLGDGFLAYWRHKPETTAAVARVVQELTELQLKAEPPFRFVLHFGQIAIGGTGLMGEESLMGQEVNRAFRMEKLASSQGQSNLLSGPAREMLKGHVEASELGAHTLLGFRQPELFYTI